MVIILFQGPATYGIKLDVNVLLALILLFQLYVIVIQAEISLRQSALFSAQYEPVLKVDTGYSSVATAKFVSPADVLVSLKNVGQTPAFNIMVGLVDREKGEILEKSAWLERSTPSLSPNESIPVFSMLGKDYNERSIDMNVIYVNVLGDHGEVTFTKFPKSDNFFMIRPRTSIGILLPLLENIRLVWRLLIWERRIRKRKAMKAK